MKKGILILGILLTIMITEVLSDLLLSVLEPWCPSQNIHRSHLQTTYSHKPAFRNFLSCFLV